VKSSTNSLESIIDFKRLETLYYVGEWIFSKSYLRGILESIPTAVKAAVGSDRMFIALTGMALDGFGVNPETIKHTCPHPSYILPEADRKRCAEAVVKTGKPAIILSNGRLLYYERFDNRLADDIVFVTVPLLTRGRGFGFFVGFSVREKPV